MNRFEFDGVIASIEEHTSKAGKQYWVVGINGDSVTVPFTVFTPPPKQGLMVHVSGKLGSYNGFGKLENARIEATGGSGLTEAQPEIEPESVANGDLPF